MDERWRLSDTARWRLAISLGAALGASLIAGCCGGLGTRDEGGCGACSDMARAGAMPCSFWDASIDVVSIEVGPDGG
jgi:hypothetical protein